MGKVWVVPKVMVWVMFRWQSGLDREHLPAFGRL